MNVSSGLTNLNIDTPELLKFKGIENGQMTKTFSRNAELTSPKKFSRKISEMVSEKINKKSIAELNNNHDLRKDLTTRRVDILLQKNENKVNIENQLLELFDEYSDKKSIKGKTFTESKPLLKQIREDIYIQLTNEIRKCTSLDGINNLNERIKLLTPSSKFDKTLKQKLDSKSIKGLQNELDKQCDRIVNQLKFDLNSKRNRASDEVNLDLEKHSIHSAVTILDKKCHDIIRWTESIRDISPKTFEERRSRLCELLTHTYQTGINSVTHHPTNLMETQKTLSTINDLSETIKKTISNSLGDNHKLLVKIDRATLPCTTHLNTELKNLSTAADRYKISFNKMEGIRAELLQVERDKITVNTKISEKEIEKQRIAKKIASANIFKRTFPSLFDRKNYKELCGAEKIISKLTKDHNQLSSLISQTNKKLSEAKSNTQIAYQGITELIERYGSSITGLDGLGDVPLNENGIPSAEDVLAAIYNSRNKNISTTEKTASAIMENTSEQFNNNQSISKNPDHLKTITLFINNKLVKNPEVSDTLSQFLNIYSQLLQPDHEGREWNFEQTFQAFTESCEKLSEQQSSVGAAQQYLYDVLSMEHDQSDAVQNEGGVTIETDSSDQESLETSISHLLDSISEEDREDEFEVDDKILEIKTLISAQHEFHHLSDQEKAKAATEIFYTTPNTNEEIRAILNQFKRT